MAGPGGGLPTDPTGGFGPRPAAGAALPLRQQVFECVRASGLIARVEVAKALSVSAGSVTAVVAELLAGGFLREEAAAVTGRGRPPVALAVAPGRGHVVGMKLGESAHTAVVVDFAGRPLAEAVLAVDPRERRVEARLEEAERLLTRVLAEAGLVRGAVSGVGLGLPGIVDHGAGRWLWSPIVDEGDVGIGALMTARLGLPVHVDNDVNMLALAELWYGAGRGETDFAVVTIEHGLGMGLVVGERLYRGAHGYGMELGHAKVQLDGALCRCGQRGCLEAYVADYALVREATTALGLHWGEAGPARQTLESLYDQAKAGNEAARTIFRRAGRYLGLGIANVLTLFDPSLVILSGARMRYDYLYAKDTIEEMRGMVPAAASREARVEVHAWGDWVWARGAATMALAALTERLMVGDA